MGPSSLLERAAQPLTGLSAAAFAALSRARGKRFFHPVGEVLPGSIDWNGRAGEWIPPAVIEPPADADVVVRFSRGLGLPERLPDFLGIAIKIRNVYGGGSDQDWLLVTSGRDPVTRHALLPASDYSSRPYSTVLPYRWKGELVTFGAFAVPGNSHPSTFRELVAAARDGLEYEIAVAPEGEAHTVVGRVTVASPETPALNVRFNPWNTSPELQPAGALNELRRRTYAASQAARPDA